MTVTKYIADLHIHSRYSRATSKASTLHGLAAWAAIKGITVVGTGDFTHPGWLAHLVEHLEPAEPGFFRLRKQTDPAEFVAVLPPDVQPDTSGIRFVLTSEISSIYKRGGRVRKVHNILFAPDFDAVRRINTTLAGIGNLESDGRPILGLDSRLLLEILLEQAPEGFLVPAHVWTPWFSLFGSKSGFDSIEECFGELSSEIFALETGLSSDPDMNRCISALDRFTLISNSDCHSPSKLGREANVFTTGFDFHAMQEAMRNPVDSSGDQRFAATIEFYPEEGKYHCDGHRKCGICLEPDETLRLRGICPACGRPLTIGVLYRVMELADRRRPLYPPGSPAVHSLVPLPELLAEMYDCGPATKKVATVYGRLINTFGSEFTLLMDTPPGDIGQVSPMLAEAVVRVRENRVIRKPGFDGEFGVIKVFSEEERAGLGGQLNLFGVKPAKKRKKKVHQVRIPSPAPENGKEAESEKILNPEQRAAVQSQSPCILVTAGPGTGKTHTLVKRVLRLLDKRPGPMTVITFTNKAVQEVRQRIPAGDDSRDRVRVDTFHGFCLDWLRRIQPGLKPAGPEMSSRILKQSFPGLSEAQRRDTAREISLYLASLPSLPQRFPAHLEPYFTTLADQGLLDLDAVIPACTAMVQENPELAGAMRSETGHLFVDEFQDLNASQYTLVKLLARDCPVFAIGDPDQAIYGFRGASPVWFHRFIDELEPERFFLTANYRSAASILEAATHVIAGNHEQQEPVVIRAAGESRGNLYWTMLSDPAAEAAFVAEQIQRLVGGTSHREIDWLRGENLQSLALSDIAVLYRTGRQARAVAEALERRAIPCQVVNLQAFYQAGETRPLFYWLLAATARADRAELLWLLGREKGIGARALEVLDQQLDQSELDPLAGLGELLPGLEKNLQQRLGKFCSLAEEFTRTAARESLPRALGLLTDHYGLDPQQGDVKRFIRLAGLADSPASFADHLRKHRNSVIYDDRAESVLLATLHASKGLEFKAVFILGCEQGLLPLAPRKPLERAAAAEHLHEERRLFYVGMTRAEKVLYLSGARKRTESEGPELRQQSCFIADIPPRLLTEPPWTKGVKKKKQVTQLRLF